MSNVTVTNNSSCMIIIPTYQPSKKDAERMKENGAVLAGKAAKGNIYINVGQTVSIDKSAYDRHRKGSKAFQALISQRNIVVRMDGGAASLDEVMTNTSAALELPEELKPIEDARSKVATVRGEGFNSNRSVEALVQDELNSRKITNAASDDADARKKSNVRKPAVNKSSKVGQHEDEPDSAFLV